VKDREEFLLAEFNKEFSVFSSDADEPLDFNAFVKQYSQLLKKITHTKQVGKLMSHLQDLTSQKDYTQLETVTQYYTVLLEQLQFLRKVAMQFKFSHDQIRLDNADQIVQ